MNKIELLKKFSTPIWLCQLNGVTKINKDFLKFFYELKKKIQKEYRDQICWAGIATSLILKNLNRI